MKNVFLFFLLCGFISSCATSEVTPTGVKVVTQSEYERILEKYTTSSIKYQGLYNTLQVEGTLVTTTMAQAQLEQTARLYIWDQPKMDEEKKKSQELSAKQTTVFVSFYTPERKNDNLHKNMTMWKLFLDVDGKRYEGKASKIKLLFSEVQAIYPYHNRFSTPYNIVFPIPVKDIESKTIRFTVTGSVDNAVLEFTPPALQP